MPVDDMAELGASTGEVERLGRRRRPAHLDLAARRGARRRPDRRAPLDHRVRQLPAPRRAPHRAAQRDLGRAHDGRGPRAPAPRPRAGDGAVRGHQRRAPGARPRAPRLGEQGAARDHRGGPQGRSAAGGGRHEQPRARHRHGRGRPRRSRSSRRRRWRAGCSASGRAGHQVGAVSKRRACSRSTAATWCRPRSSPSGCARAHRVDAHARATRSTSSRSRSWRCRAMRGWKVDDLLALVRRAAPFATLPQSAYDAVLDMLAGRYPSDEFAELRPRLVWDRAPTPSPARPGAQRLAVTSGGTIPAIRSCTSFSSYCSGSCRRW